MIDTSVAIAIDVLPPGRLPHEFAISTLTVAEMVLGLAKSLPALARARRQTHLLRIERAATLLDFDSACASAYGQVCEATFRIGRKANGSRSVDLLIAATALAHGLPLYTCNAADLRGLDGLVEIVDLA